MADFTNIDGVYAKDTELRSGIDTLRTTVLSNTIKPLTVTKNGTYTAIPSSGTYGYSPITVDVQEEPWQPLEDGYSNFWFELTNDTLSPRLNFTAKNADATIDWGDGSGEQALTTLTPTHTYSKAGKYVVKVKGVTDIGIQYPPPLTKYCLCITAIELNNEVTTIPSSAFFMAVSLKNASISYVTTIDTAAFAYCSALSNILLSANLTSLGQSTFSYEFSLSSIVLPTNLATIPNNVFSYCRLLNNVVIPATVTSIGNSAFAYCSSLTEIHCLGTVPPTLGTTPFAYLPTNWIAYVPVGYGDTYKSAAGWSTYADHILEEGQNLSKSQLRAIAEEQKKSDNGEEMR